MGLGNDNVGFLTINIDREECFMENCVKGQIAPACIIAITITIFVLMHLAKHSQFFPNYLFALKIALECYPLLKLLITENDR